MEEKRQILGLACGSIALFLGFMSVISFLHNDNDMLMIPVLMLPMIYFGNNALDCLIKIDPILMPKSWLLSKRPGWISVFLLVAFLIASQAYFRACASWQNVRNYAELPWAPFCAPIRDIAGRIINPDVFIKGGFQFLIVLELVFLLILSIWCFCVSTQAKKTHSHVHNSDAKPEEVE